MALPGVTMLALVVEHGSFYNYLRSLDHLSYYERLKALASQFSCLGRAGACVFLRYVDEETPV